MGWFSNVVDAIFGGGGKSNGNAAEIARLKAEAERIRTESNQQLVDMGKAKDAQMQSLMEIQKQSVQQNTDAQARSAQLQQQQLDQAAEADRRRQAETDANNITAANQKTDLLAENVTNVVAAGTADQSASADALKKKIRGVGLSAQLGINV